MTFDGFSTRAFDFYRGFLDDPSKAYWTANKDVYLSEVREPMVALVEVLAPEFGEGKVFRPYRDVRFSRDKMPYKLSQGAVVGDVSGLGYYLQIDAEGLLLGGGFRAHSSEQVDRFRRAVDDSRTGPELVGIIEGLRTDKFSIEGERLKTKPRGYDAGHPRIDLLRHKEVMAVKSLGIPDWLSTSAAANAIGDQWRVIKPLSNWVATNVGPA